jgi:hypothetical protein
VFCHNSTVTYNFIEDHYIIHVATTLVSISQGSVEVKIADKHPVNSIINLQAIEPEDKLISVRPLTGTIHSGKKPSVTIVCGEELYCDGELANLNDLPIEDRIIPSH